MLRADKYKHKLALLAAKLANSSASGTAEAQPLIRVEIIVCTRSGIVNSAPNLAATT
jgi:hypothetical protein